MHVIHWKDCEDKKIDKFPYRGQVHDVVGTSVRWLSKYGDDGTGYPDGLNGKNIPLEARIVAVADVYDALTNDRPYRKSYSMAEAVEIMAGMQESTFDPEISGLFFSLLEENKHVQAEESFLVQYGPS